MDVAVKLKQLVMCFFLLLKYLASNLPAGPGIKISTILLSIKAIDNYYQNNLNYFLKKIRLPHVTIRMLIFI